MKRNLKIMEQNKLDVIKEIKRNKISKHMAAEKLNCTMRNINYLIKKFEREGGAGFIHKNTGRISNRAISEEVEAKIIDLYETKYNGYNYKHFRDMLIEEEEILVSYTWLRKMFLRNRIYSPKLKQKTTKKIIAETKSMIESPKTTKAMTELLQRTMIPLNKAHPMVNRKTMFGERVQTDASKHIWFGNSYSHLHAFVDDATGMILGAFFSKEETLMSYYEITKQMFTKYGTPEEILTDKRTVFWSPKEKESDMHSDSLTQYGFMCHNFGIKLTTTSIPQTKGRIERLWETLQDRLPKDLLRKGITTMEAANEFLNNEYIDYFNKKFAIPLSNNIKNIFIKIDKIEDINFYLGRRFERTVNHGGSIKYMGKYYIPHTAGTPVIYKNKTKLFVVETFDGDLYANSYSEWMPLVEVLQNSTYKEVYTKKDDKKIPKNIVTNSPWKYTNWIFFKNSKKNKNIDFGK